MYLRKSLLEVVEVVAVAAVVNEAVAVVVSLVDSR